jgi:hypothetical protein
MFGATAKRTPKKLLRSKMMGNVPVAVSSIIIIVKSVGRLHRWDDMKHEKEIQKIVNDIIMPISKNIIEKEGHEHNPTFIIRGKSGFKIIGAFFNTPEDKARTVEMVRQNCIKEDAEYYVFVSEAWQIKRKKIDPDEQPSKAKDRQEVLNIIANNRSGESVGYICNIKRDGHKRSLGKPEKLEGKSGGLFHIRW